MILRIRGKMIRLTKRTLSLQLHFVHERSSDPNAIPLIFSHGWPGSFIEAFKIIKKLTNPGMGSLLWAPCSLSPLLALMMVMKCAAGYA